MASDSRAELGIELSPLIWFRTQRVQGALTSPAAPPHPPPPPREHTAHTSETNSVYSSQVRGLALHKNLGFMA